MPCVSLHELLLRMRVSLHSFLRSSVRLWCAAPRWLHNEKQCAKLLKKNLQYIVRNQNDWCVIDYNGAEHYNAMLVFEPSPLDDEEVVDDEEDNRIMMCLCALVRSLHARLHARRHARHVRSLRQVNSLHACLLVLSGYASNA